ELIGCLCSLMTLTPYAFWRRQHARHHGSWNNLGRRAASGLDIYSSCMTVAEYRALGRWRRCLVRLTNHPIVANLLLPPLVFVILYRVPFDAAKGWRRERGLSDQPCLGRVYRRLGSRSASTLTLRTGLQALGYALWDSDLERLVPFRFARTRRLARPKPNSRCARKILRPRNSSCYPGAQVRHWFRHVRRPRPGFALD